MHNQRHFQTVGKQTLKLPSRHRSPTRRIIFRTFFARPCHFLSNTSICNICAVALPASQTKSEVLLKYLNFVCVANFFAALTKFDL